MNEFTQGLLIGLVAIVGVIVCICIETLLVVFFWNIIAIYFGLKTITFIIALSILCLSHLLGSAFNGKTIIDIKTKK